MRDLQIETIDTEPEVKSAPPGARFLVFADEWEEENGRPEGSCIYLSTPMHFVHVAAIAPQRFHETCIWTEVSVPEIAALLEDHEVIQIHNLYLADWKDGWTVILRLPNRRHEAILCGLNATPYRWKGHPFIAERLATRLEAIMDGAQQQTNQGAPIKRPRTA